MRLNDFLQSSDEAPDHSSVGAITPTALVCRQKQEMTTTVVKVQKHRSRLLDNIVLLSSFT